MDQLKLNKREYRNSHTNYKQWWVFAVIKLLSVTVLWFRINLQQHLPIVFTVNTCLIFHRIYSRINIICRTSKSLFNFIFHYSLNLQSVVACFNNIYNFWCVSKPNRHFTHNFCFESHQRSEEADFTFLPASISPLFHALFLIKWRVSVYFNYDSSPIF